MRLYVGNLSFDTSENDLREAFERFGAVTDVKIMTDPAGGQSRGFGFISMGGVTEGKAAISGLDGTALHGRNLTVNEARPRTERPAGRSYTGAGR